MTKTGNNFFAPFLCNYFIEKHFNFSKNSIKFANY